MNDIRIYWLWLMLVFQPANPRVWWLSKHYDNVIRFVNALLKGNVDGLTDSEAKRVNSVKISDAQRLLEYCNKNDINVYCYESEGYPEKLREILNPPSVLFCYGNLDFWGDRVNVAVVGTRKPSEYSIMATENICKGLIKNNILISTGFAMGIDQIANSVSLEGNAPTLAISGRAIDEDYPKGSNDIKMQVAKNGAVVSEYYPTSKPVSNAFVNRNRILIGLCDGVLFCECSAESRGLDNAKQARMQGKPIFVIPPCDITNPRYFGQRNLIRNGALCVFGSEDILYNLSYDNFENLSIIKSVGEYMLPSDDSVLFKGNEKPKKRKKIESKSIENKNPVQDKKIRIDYAKLTPLQGDICKLLEDKNLIVDEIALQIGEDISVILSELVELEIEGFVQALAGKMYGLKC